MSVDPQIRIGMSGWVYEPWRGEFYPKGVRQKDELAYASSKVGSIEINGSFYALPKPSSWLSWRETVPDGFVFAVKAPRFITHVKRLEDVEGALANFFACGLLSLGPKLGPILWQLPPSLPFDEQTLEEFLALLPHTTGDAARIAAGHSERMTGSTDYALDRSRPLRHAVEVRNHGFDAEAWPEMLERFDVASVTADTAGKWPRIDRVTSDFAYARLHGDEKIYTSGYDEAGLDRWEEWARRHLDEGRDVYVYFDNDQKVRAPFDAMAFIERMRD